MKSSVSRQFSIKGPLDPSDRIRLEGLVRQAVQRFEREGDEGRQEEFRQLLKSYMRFYSFVAQVVSLASRGAGRPPAYQLPPSRLASNQNTHARANTKSSTSVRSNPP
jgi:type I restriction enzyme, R subunit